MKRHKTWLEMTSAQRRGILALSAVEVLLAGAAWADLARRPAEAVHGRKRWWAVAIAVNFVGPLAYFRWGRKGHAARPHRAKERCRRHEPGTAAVVRVSSRSSRLCRRAPGARFGAELVLSSPS
ncbi:phospholipase D-like protein [Saccharothrix carnea]|uniref:Phospholipase D-like protein n=1 Tax=Saccharothrix carnea TaxID=1280637 RepID=A0A2P8IFT7_SACCR|nr:PLD nuclease N-terminal domain-containing protein [Saccharothrix carnea]PSL57331.1 phospholipase D-like protein [Saccharothrix carnea]